MHHYAGLIAAATGTAAGALLAVLLLLFFQLIGYNLTTLHWVVFSLVGAGVGLFCSIHKSELMVEYLGIKEHLHEKRHAKHASLAFPAAASSPSRKSSRRA